MAARMSQIDVYAPADTKIGKKLGGGTLKELVKRDVKTKAVLHYALAYINPAISTKDHGRVLGYDNSHNYDHQHFLGTITNMPAMSYEALFDMFDRQWRTLAMQHVNGQSLSLIP
jgi:hypothetical protein